MIHLYISFRATLYVCHFINSQSTGQTPFVALIIRRLDTSYCRLRIGWLPIFNQTQQLPLLISSAFLKLLSFFWTKGIKVDKGNGNVQTGPIQDMRQHAQQLICSIWFVVAHSISCDDMTAWCISWHTWLVLSLPIQKWVFQTTEKKRHFLFWWPFNARHCLQLSHLLLFQLICGRAFYFLWWQDCLVHMSEYPMRAFSPYSEKSLSNYWGKSDDLSMLVYNFHTFCTSSYLFFCIFFGPFLPIYHNSIIGNYRLSLRVWHLVENWEEKFYTFYTFCTSSYLFVYTFFCPFLPVSHNSVTGNSPDCQCLRVWYLGENWEVEYLGTPKVEWLTAEEVN